MPYNNRLKLAVTSLACASVAPAAETKRYPDRRTPSAAVVLDRVEWRHHADSTPQWTLPLFLLLCG